MPQKKLKCQGFQHSLGIGGQQTDFDVVFVKDLFRHRIRQSSLVSTGWRVPSFSP